MAKQFCNFVKLLYLSANNLRNLSTNFRILCNGVTQHCITQDRTVCSEAKSYAYERISCIRAAVNLQNLSVSARIRSRESREFQ